MRKFLLTTIITVLAMVGCSSVEEVKICDVSVVELKSPFGFNEGFTVIENPNGHKFQLRYSSKALPYVGGDSICITYNTSLKILEIYENPELLEGEE